MTPLCPSTAMSRWTTFCPFTSLSSLPCTVPPTTLPMGRESVLAAACVDRDRIRFRFLGSHDTTLQHTTWPFLYTSEADWLLPTPGVCGMWQWWVGGMEESVSSKGG